MGTDPRTPTLAQVVNRATERALCNARTALPGRVERYDAAAGVVDVKPLLFDTIEADDGTETPTPLQVIANVPIVFPGAGSFVLTFPVQRGDFVLLVFADRSLDRWTGTSGADVDPVDPRRHNLSDAIAIPGLRPRAWSNAAGNTDHATIGQDGGLRVHLKPATVEVGDGAADAAALASNVESRLRALEAQFTATGHTHATPSGVTTATVQNPIAPISLAPPAVASSLLKLKG